ncbi:hypothetical protein Tco_0140261 [Tanacetum coccineum]
MTASTNVLIAAVVAALPSSSPPPSPLSPWSSPLPQIPSPPLPIPSPPLPLPPPTVDSPTYAKAPLGYRAAEIRLRAASPPLLLPSTTHRDDITWADMPLWKKARFTALAFGYEVGESLAAAARQSSLDVATVDATAGRLVSREDTYEIHVRLEHAQDDRALQRAQVNMLFRDRQFHRHTALLLDSEARHSREAWSHSMNCSKAVHAELQAYRAQTQLTSALRRIQTLEAREPEPARDLKP